jgi:type VI secretion system secreted protein Hcp
MASDYFLKIAGIEGESTKKGFENQIEIESFSWGETQPTSQSAGTGSGSGKVEMQGFSFTTKSNKSSPKLMLACATGQHIASAVLTARKAGGKQEEYLKWTLSDIVVSSYQTGGSAGSDTVPTDQFSLSFSKIQTEYKPQDAKGGLGAAVTAGYDLKAMAKV